MVNGLSVGFSTGKLSQQIVHRPSIVTILPQTPGASDYTLKNEFLTVVVSAHSNWAISSIQDVAGNSLLKADGTGNDLVFYNDDGNVYQFANETGDNTFAPDVVKFNASGPGLGPIILESGPVRVRLKTVVIVKGTGGWTQS
jgi:alpha-mannosidase